MKTKFLLGLIFLIAGLTNAQPASNLEVIYGMISNSIDSIKPHIDGKELFLEFNSPSDFSFLRNQVILNFSDNGFEIYDTRDKTDKKLGYTIDNIKVNYDKVFRDGLFGDYFVERGISLNGSYSVIEEKVMKSGEFNQFQRDSVNYDMVKDLESVSIPFTKGAIPPEPFWKGILEPVIAVSAAAVTVFLFFSVRSK